MNIKPCLLLETKIFEFMVREGWRKDGKACLVVGFPFPSLLSLSFVTPLLEAIYLIAGFTLLGTFSPFCHFVIHANYLPFLSFCPEKNTMNAYRIIGTEKKSSVWWCLVIAFSLQTTVW